MKNNRRFTILAILSLVGLIASVILTRLYYDLRSGMAGFKSFCNLGATMNCDVVAASPYAEFIGGIPLSSFSAGWFLGLFAVALIGRMSVTWQREARRVALVMTAIATVFSVVYFIIMAAVIKTFCLFCLVVDVAAILGLITVATMKIEAPRRGQQEEPGQWKTFTGVALGCIFVAVVGLKGLDKVNVDSSMLRSSVEGVMQTAPVPIDAGSEFPSFGPENAPVTVVEFIDFQCGYCRMGAQTLHALRNRYPDQVRVVARMFPLDPSCNPEMKNAGHPAACEAAKSLICAKKQGQEYAAYEKLFDNQASLAPGVPTRLVSEIQGVDGEQLKSCLDSTETAEAVARDLREGQRLGVRSTPTLFINGRKTEGVYPLPIWDELVKRFTEGK